MKKTVHTVTMHVQHCQQHCVWLTYKPTAERRGFCTIVLHYIQVYKPMHGYYYH